MTAFTIHSLEDLGAAVEWALEAANGRKKWLLYGDMGVGKTTFVKTFCQHQGVSDAASSPTYSLVNAYKGPQDTWVHHMDLYRLKDMAEALDFGIEDYFDDPFYCLIEWPEIIEPILPDDVFRLKFSLNADNSRVCVVL